MLALLMNLGFAGGDGLVIVVGPTWTIALRDVLTVRMRDDVTTVRMRDVTKVRIRGDVTRVV